MSKDTRTLQSAPTSPHQQTPLTAHRIKLILPSFCSAAESKAEKSAAESKAGSCFQKVPIDGHCPTIEHHHENLPTIFRGQNHAREQTQSYGYAGFGDARGVNAMAACSGLAQNFGRRGKRGGEREGKECPHDNHGETKSGGFRN